MERTGEEESGDSLRRAEPVDIENGSQAEREALHQIQLPNTVPQPTLDQEGFEVHTSSTQVVHGSGSDFDDTVVIDDFLKDNIRKSRFSRGPERGAEWLFAISFLMLSAAFIAAFGTWGILCRDSIGDRSCMAMFPVPECKPGEFLARQTARELPTCRRCSAQQNCAEHTAECVPNTKLRRCVAPAAGYHLVDGVPEPCAAMDGILGVSHCTRCDNSSLVGCVAGICMVGYHTFVNGDPPSCTRAPRNPCPGRYSEPLTAWHSQYQMWQIESEDVVRTWYRGRRDISPRSSAFAQAYCGPEGPNWYDRQDQAISSGTSCASILAGGNLDWKCETGFAPNELADQTPESGAGWCNEACGYNTAMAAVGPCGLNGECCTCCPLNGETEADTTERCLEEARKYPPPENGQSQYYDGAGRSYRPMEHCEDLQSWVDARGLSCLQQPCQDGNAVVSLEWTPDPTVSEGPYDLQQTSLDQMQLLDEYDLDRATLAARLAHFNDNAPTTGPHAGKSALEACCTCGGGKSPAPSPTNSSTPTNVPQDEVFTTMRPLSRQMLVLRTLVLWSASCAIYWLVSQTTVLEVDTFLVVPLALANVSEPRQRLFQWIMCVAKRADTHARKQNGFSHIDQLFLVRFVIAFVSTTWWLVLLWGSAADVSPVWLQCVMLMIYVWQTQFVRQLLQWRCAVNIAYFLMLASPQGTLDECRSDRPPRSTEHVLWPTDRPRPSMWKAVGPLAWLSLLSPLATLLECFSFYCKPAQPRSEAKAFFLFGAKFSLPYVSMYGWSFYKASIEAANLLNGVNSGVNNEVCHPHSLGHAPIRDEHAAGLAKLLLRASERLDLDFTLASAGSAIVFGGVACAWCWLTESATLEWMDFLTAFVVNVVCSSVMTAQYEAAIHTVLLCFVEEPTFLQFSDCENYWKFLGNVPYHEADGAAPIDSLPEELVDDLVPSSVQGDWKRAIARAKQKHFEKLPNRPFDLVDHWLRWSGLHFHADDEAHPSVEFEPYRDELKKRFGAPDKWQALEHFNEKLGEAKKRRPKETVSKQEKVIVVSCPEIGTLDLDGKGPYDQNVMKKVQELQTRGLIKVGFDKAGTSTAVAEDRPLFDEAKRLQEAGKSGQAKDEIRKTAWFNAYKTSIKTVIKVAAQEFDGVLVIVSIAGGLVTQVEYEEMPRIVSDAIEDAERFSITVHVRQRHMSYSEFLQTYADKPSHRLQDGTQQCHWFALCCHDTWLSDDKMILHEKIDRDHLARQFVSELHDSMACRDAEDVYSLRDEQILQVLRSRGCQNKFHKWKEQTLKIHSRHASSYSPISPRISSNAQQLEAQNAQKARALRHKIEANHSSCQQLEDRLRCNREANRQKLEERRNVEDAQSMVAQHVAEQRQIEEEHRKLKAVQKKKLQERKELLSQLERTVEEIFARYDSDGIDGLNRQEFRAWVVSMFVGDLVDEEDIDMLMKQLDGDGDDAISHREMKKFLREYCSKHHWVDGDPEAAVTNAILQE